MVQFFVGVAAIIFYIKCVYWITYFYQSSFSKGESEYD